VERLINRLEPWRRIVSRHEKWAVYDLAMRTLVATLLCL
jgi:hypothetical protein